MKYVSFIPLRSGSKGLPNKNILSLRGKELYMYSVEQSLRTSQKCFISTDIESILFREFDKDVEVFKRPQELAGDEKAYRSLTRSWFLNSPLWAALQKAAERDVQLIVTTDHGTIRVKTPSKVVGDRDTTTNLRYKVGRNLQYNKKDVLDFRNPIDAGLPRPNVSSTFIFAKDDLFFLYPNNYNYYLKYYIDTFQHGGISLEEVICPVVRLSSK